MLRLYAYKTQVPSLEDVCRQAKGVRLLNEQRQYMAQYRREKKAKQVGDHAADFGQECSSPPFPPYLKHDDSSHSCIF